MPTSKRAWEEGRILLLALHVTFIPFDSSDSMTAFCKSTPLRDAIHAAWYQPPLQKIPLTRIYTHHGHVLQRLEHGMIEMTRTGVFSHVHYEPRIFHLTTRQHPSDFDEHAAMSSATMQEIQHPQNLQSFALLYTIASYTLQGDYLWACSQNLSHIALSALGVSEALEFFFSQILSYF